MKRWLYPGAILTLLALSTVASRSASGTNQDYWAVEDSKEREKLPLYQIIPAARTQELTPANGYPKPETFLTWHRSHGDNGGARYSALDQINRATVTNLQVAWVYHSNDGSNNLQCNPIIVGGIIIAPTPGKFLVGINAESGTELWRFKPEGRPAFRGLIYWPGTNSISERVLFCAGQTSVDGARTDSVPQIPKRTRCQATRTSTRSTAHGARSPACRSTPLRRGHGSPRTRRPPRAQ